MAPCLFVLYQIRMILNRLFNPLWLDTDMALCGTGTAMLRQLLYRANTRLSLTPVGKVPILTVSFKIYRRRNFEKDYLYVSGPGAVCLPLLL